MGRCVLALVVFPKSISARTDRLMRVVVFNKPITHMKDSRFLWIVGVVVFVVVGSVVLFTRHTASPAAVGAATSGLAASVASTTQETVLAASATTIAATSTCSSRVVSTGAQAIVLTFSDYAAQSPTLAGFGFYQPASTTVAYDSGLYGCGLMKAISGGGANSIVTVGVTY